MLLENIFFIIIFWDKGIRMHASVAIFFFLILFFF